MNIMRLLITLAIGKGRKKIETHMNYSQNEHVNRQTFFDIDQDCYRRMRFSASRILGIMDVDEVCKIN